MKHLKNFSKVLNFAVIDQRSFHLTADRSIRAFFLQPRSQGLFHSPRAREKTLGTRFEFLSTSLKVNLGTARKKRVKN